MDYSTSSPFSPKVEAPLSLPKVYGEDTLVLMARDPWWGFAYWEVTEKTSKAVQGQVPPESKIVLRVYDVSGNKSVDAAQSHHDYVVGSLVGSWYLQLNAPEKNFVVELGYLTPDGKFLALIRSNVMLLPRPDVSQVFDSDWMVVEEEFMRIYKLSGGGKQAPSSEALAPVTEELRRLIARRMKGEAASGGLAASAFGSAGLP